MQSLLLIGERRKRKPGQPAKSYSPRWQRDGVKCELAIGGLTRLDRPLWFGLCASVSLWSKD